MTTHLIPASWARSGVYRITHRATGRHYIGSSQDVRRRLQTHLKHLADGRHYNEHLQASWDKHGPDAFAVAPMEWVENGSALLRVEQEWIDATDAFRGGYNLAPFAGSNRGSRRAGVYDWFPTPAEADRWVARMYEAGVPVTVVARWYGTSQAMITLAARRGGAAILTPGAAQRSMRFREMGLDAWFDSPDDAGRQFRSAHEAGVSVNRIAEAFGTQSAVIARYIKGAGGRPRSLTEARRNRSSDLPGVVGGVRAGRWARVLYEDGFSLRDVARATGVRVPRAADLICGAGGTLRTRGEACRVGSRKRRVA